MAMFGRVYDVLRRFTSWRRRALGFCTVTTVAMALMLSLGAVSAPSAGATATYKYYSSSANPTDIYVGRSTPVTITLANLPSSNQPFGSAELTFGGLAQSAVVIDGNTGGWTAFFVGGGTSPTMLLTSGNKAPIAPGSSLHVTVTLTPTAAGSIPVTTVVKQSNNFSGSGNTFNRQGSDPVITVNPVSLSFSQQPSAVQQSTNKTSYYMCPPVSVLVSADGQPVSGISVTLQDGNTGDPGLYFGTSPVSSSGTSAISDSNGLATFGSCGSGLAATNLGAGYTLIASSAAATGPVTSNRFSVVQLLKDCTTGPCTSGPLDSPNTGTTGNISANGSTSYQLLGSFGLGQLTCDSSVTTTAGDPIVVQTSAGAPGTVTMTFPKAVVNSLANNGTPLMQVCAGTTQPFSWTNQQPLANQTYPYQGLVPNCPTGYTGVNPEICVVSRSKKAANETIVIYASDLSDPSFW